MNDEFVTVATYASPVEANLAKSYLEDAGVKAFLSGEQMVETAWYLSNAVGGIKLQTASRNAEEALAILAERVDSMPVSRDKSESVEESAELLTASGSAAGDADSDGGADTDGDDVETQLTSREEWANRALRSALFGLLWMPLQPYVTWILLKVFLSDERLGPVPRRNAIVAAAINVPWMLGVCALIRWLMVA